MHGYSYLSPILVYCSLEIHLGANTANPFLSPNVTFIKDVRVLAGYITDYASFLERLFFANKTNCTASLLMKFIPYPFKVNEFKHLLRLIANLKPVIWWLDGPTFVELFMSFRACSGIHHTATLAVSILLLIRLVDKMVIIYTLIDRDAKSLAWNSYINWRGPFSNLNFKMRS